MKRIPLMIMIGMMVMLAGCDVLKYGLEQAAKQTTQGGVTDSQIVSGLKEALKVGTSNAVSTLSVKDGFFRNAQFKIPFPPEVKKVETTLRALGMNSLVDDFIEKLNRGAEEAVKEATPIFVNAITSMTIADGRNILFGGDNAATQYFRSKTSGALFNAFQPRVKNVLDNKVKVTQAWNNVASAYNKVPGVTPVTTDLPKYVTDRSINALFVRIGEEEKKIRENPAARVNDILKKVFGELDKK
ncbi:MAG: DUF4197 domain-containing protein [Bacteroidales bacterium]